MTYRFDGLITQQDCTKLRLGEAEYSIRNIRPVHDFFGIRMNQTMDEPDLVVDSCAKKLIDAGITSGLVLRYVTWAGAIEYLYGFEIKDASIVESSRFDSSTSEALEKQFIGLVTAFGLRLSNEGYFAPFERGYWGE